MPGWIACCIRSALDRAFVESAFHASAPAAMREQALRESGSNPWHVVTAFYRHLQWERWTADRLAPVTGPIRILCGAADGIIEPTSSALLLAALRESRASAARSAGATGSDDDAARDFDVTLTEVPFAAHQLMQERPAIVNAAIDEILGLSPGAGHS